MKNFKLRRHAAIIGYTMLAVVLFSSCQSPEFNPKRAFILLKSDDNNWTHSAIIECDSINMISPNECDFWIDGRKSKIFGGIIKIRTNPDYKPKDSFQCASESFDKMEKSYHELMAQ